MAITNATTLADYASGIGTQGSTLTVDANNKRVGIGTTNPQAMLQVGTGVSVYGDSGIVSATSYYGDGSELTGITAGATLSAGSGDQKVVLTSKTSGQVMTTAAIDAELSYNSDTDTLSATTFSGNITGTAATFTGNVSIGGTLTYEDVTNVDSVGVITARSGIRIGAGQSIGSDGALTYYGDGSNLTGVDSTALKDSNDVVRVQANTSGAVVTGVLTATSFSGDGSNLTFTPRILSFDPEAISTGVAVDKTITITFDQNISFSGNGTVELRSGSSSGTVIESFAISSGSPATGLSISGPQLIINPTSDFSSNTLVYVILPATGIVNSAGTVYGGLNNYFFRTIVDAFSAQGGVEYVLQNGSSPTGYYKYHVFSTSGILTTSAPAQSAADLDMMILGGGGGGGSMDFQPGPPSGGAGGGGGAGGYIALTQSNIVMSGGTYTVSIGSSGAGAFEGAYNNAGTYGSDGGDTTITPPASPTTYVYRAYGGGGGGGSPNSAQADGAPGGSGGGGSTPRYSNISSGPTAGGSGLVGQGYNGGNGTSAYILQPPSNEDGRSSGGGGGAGGAGDAATSANRYWGTSSTNDNRNRGGAGGIGVANPLFAGPALTNSGIPADRINQVGPTGLYGGGGGGSSSSTDLNWGGAGGSGIGGDGYTRSNQPDSDGQLPNAPSTFKAGVASSPYPTNFEYQMDAKSFGSGGGASSNDSETKPDIERSGAGTPGVIMIRYETPAP